MDLVRIGVICLGILALLEMLFLGHQNLRMSKYGSGEREAIFAYCKHNYLIISSRGYSGKVNVYDVDTGALICSRFLDKNSEEACRIREAGALKLVYDSKSKIVICEREIQRVGRIIKNKTIEACYSNEFQAPAVSDGKGVLVNVSIRACPGAGRLYVNLGPLYGVELQETISESMNIVKGILGIDTSKYDIYISFSGKNVTIDGPSIGAALTSALYFTLTGKEFPNNVCITGAIDNLGKLRKVGGIMEKAEACKKGNKTIFIMPKENEVGWKMQCKEEKKELPGITWVYRECHPIKVNMKEEIWNKVKIPVLSFDNIIYLLDYLQHSY